VQKVLEWLIANQEETGLWKARYLSGSDKKIYLWTRPHVCRLLKRLKG